MSKKMFNNDLEIFNYINGLNSRGIYIYLENDTLKYRSMLALKQNELKELKLYKKQLIEFLKLRKENTVPLSPLQLAYMIGQTENYILNKVNAHYYIEYTKDNIDIKRLEDALNSLIIKNEALRLIILSSGEGLILNKVPRYNIKSYSIKKDSDRYRIRENLSKKRYSYDSWPMFTFQVGKSDNQNDVLHFSFDCSILDAWSAGALIKKLFDLYKGKSIKTSSITYKSYLKLSESYKKEDNIEKLLKKADEYWTKKAKENIEPPKLIDNSKLKYLKKSDFSRKRFILSEDVTNSLIKFSKDFKIMLSALMIALYMNALSKISKNKNFAVNMTMFGKLPVANNVGDLIGEFTNIGLIINEYKSESFLDYIKKIQKQILKLIEYRAYDGSNIIKKSIDNNLKNNIGFPVVVTCMLSEEYKDVTNGFKEIYSISQTPQVYLDHHIRKIDSKIVLSFDYIDELINDNLIEKMIENYRELLNKILIIRENINEK
ncbi:condensation domain-containing protein [Anaerococcus vaginalis]|uniref:condensation domain-containing protein n=2 Tax=Peptoniphilaceae TaxID=1570339 RepID=UPI00242B79ED|nr:condensation domain-containing protein [Anaerococcus vaginalis]MDU5989432.1 condensation domain-containing protein [Anaerococcus vaginalis]